MTVPASPAKPAPTSPLKAAIVQVTPFQQNCTLLWDEATKIGAVVDPGGDLDVIEGAIKETGISIEKILLTHGHIDHAGGADELRERLKVKIEGPHKADIILLEALEKQGKLYSIPGCRNVVPDRWLEEGETVTVGGHTFELFHCPGHSPGSMVFFNRAQRLALVGDVIFQGSIGRTDFPYGDHDALINAIHTKLFPLGDDVTFICGHGRPSQFGIERKSNPFLV
jgi:glyoxylase-like metal-dependent hydrolase (beta-lactamase superfamily II)